MQKNYSAAIFIFLLFILVIVLIVLSSRTKPQVDPTASPSPVDPIIEKYKALETAPCFNNEGVKVPCKG